ncbi:hypothetical protein ACFZ8E_05790 [Methylobacterium sp. HMF5984]|uniref:hypothetical protein n=1 Tax=Methylobacterium sp. HMF5984 TaxID=3367370 RepID=UPI003852A9C4
MTGVEIAGILKDYGPWGLCAILMLVIAKLYRDNQALSTGYIERVILGLNAATSASTSVQGALSELRHLIDASGKAVGEHSGHIALLVEKVQHGFGNTASAMQAVANELQRLRDRDDQRNRDRNDRGRP